MKKLFLVGLVVALAACAGPQGVQVQQVAAKPSLPPKPEASTQIKFDVATGKVASVDVYDSAVLAAYYRSLTPVQQKSLGWKIVDGVVRVLEVGAGVYAGVEQGKITRDIVEAGYGAVRDLSNPAPNITTTTINTETNTSSVGDYSGDSSGSSSVGDNSGDYSGNGSVVSGEANRQNSNDANQANVSNPSADGE